MNQTILQPTRTNERLQQTVTEILGDAPAKLTLNFAGNAALLAALRTGSRAAGMTIEKYTLMLLKRMV